MIEQDNKEKIFCCHRVHQYQYHERCNELAAICIKSCQGFHNHNRYQATTTPQHLRAILISPIQVYLQRFKREMKVLRRQLQLLQEESLKLMQKELSLEVMSKMKLNRDILIKIDNNRLEKLKCGQIYSLIHSIQEIKVDKDYFENIYQRYFRVVKETYTQKKEGMQRLLKQGHQVVRRQVDSPPLNHISVQTDYDQPVCQNHLQEIHYLHQQLNSALFHFNQQRIQKEKAIKELKGLIKLEQNGGDRLSRHTWNIIKVMTKKFVPENDKKAIHGSSKGLIDNKEDRQMIDFAMQRKD